MRVNVLDYRYKVCPTCKSKRLSPIGLVYFGSTEYQKEEAYISRTGHLCDNCDRYIIAHKVKFWIDRAEMRRDMERLKDYLKP